MTRSQGDIGANTLSGGASHDVLEGGDGDDVLIGGRGTDYLRGGAGTDTANYAGSSAGVNVSLVAGDTNTGGDAAGDVLSGVENLLGSAHHDTLTGGAGANHLSGGAGTDTASYAGSSAGVSVSLVAGDTNTGGDAAGDVLSGVENLLGSAHHDTLTGDIGANTLSGGAGPDILEGGDGDDVLNGGRGSDDLRGGAGTDTASYAGSSAGVNVSLVAGVRNTGGDADNDVLSGVENLLGSAHDDTLTGGAGANHLSGGAGTDTASYAGSSAGVSVSLVAGDTNTGGDADGDVLSGVENLLGSAYHDTLTGDIGANTLSGGASHDVLEGGDGDDVLIGGHGTDYLRGGAGTDTASYAGSSAGVNVSLVAGVRNTGGDADNDVLSGVENLLGSAYHDTLTGDTAANRLIGGGGNDTLNGGDGADRLYGGDGNDTLDAGSVSGATWQYVYGESGNDTYRYSQSSGNVFVASESATTGTADQFVFTDLSLGQISFDTIDYGTSYGGNIGMAVRLRWNESGTAREAQLALEGQHIETYAFTGGTTVNRFIVAGASDTTLSGTSGNDVIVGNGIANTFTGGAGDDVFVFEAGFGADTIADFNASNAEKIDLTEISGITDFVDLTTNHLSDNSGTARITLDSGNTIDLTGITVGQIGTALDYSADDFLF